jgi:penicillin-binding protein 1A
MNIPTFNLFLKVGFYKLDSLWKKMGFSYGLKYHPSLALGTAEANLREVTVAYSSFANGGYKVTPHSILSIKTYDGEIIWENKLDTKKPRILTPKTSLLMGAILQKAIREGTGAPLRYTYNVSIPMAGKTGTSQNYADAWFAAFNPSLVIVSRVGASYPSIHFNSSRNGQATALALPLVAMTLKKAQEDSILVKQIDTSFPSLPQELADALNCPDFKEDDLIDKFKDFFKRDEIIFDQPTIDKPILIPGPKKNNIFKRIFRKNRR